MALPKIEYPTFNETLPSNGKKVTFRPFTGKEEKILLIAKESDEDDAAESIITSLKQIMNNCILDYNVDDLAIIDIEFMFLKIRSVSVDTVAEFTIVDKDTEENVKLKLDLNDMKVVEDENFRDIIKVNDDTYLKMKHPSWEELITLLRTGEKSAEEYFRILYGCIGQVVHGEDVHNLNDYSEEEIIQFIDDLPNTTIEEIRDYFETLPVIRHEIKYKNSNGAEKTFVLEGLRTFFT